MNVLKNRSKSSSVIDRRNQGYHHRGGTNSINLYQNIPKVELSLDDFEEYALARVKVLRKLELLQMRHVPYDQYGRHLDSLLVPLQDKQVDETSHFILRLAFCRTNDLRQWLITQETALMRYRLDMASSSTSSTGGGGTVAVDDKALASVLPEAKLLTAKEREAIQSQLVAATPNTTPTQVITSKYYAVPFEHALSLVGRRQVFVRNGLAYVPQSKLIPLVQGQFRTILSKELTELATVSRPPSEVRMDPLIKNLATLTANENKSTEFDNHVSGLTATTVQAHLKHMPLCMAKLQLGLQSDKHLKHWGRLQYGLFLKSAGLSLDDALIYFERQFAKAKSFQKEYSYNVRHMYGKEGKRTSYPAYSCSKILHGTTPNDIEHHGCPYKHTSTQEVTRLLTNLGISAEKRTGILSLQKSNQYQLACVEHFLAAHPSSSSTTKMDNVGNHPNSWFNASVEYGTKQNNNNNIKQENTADGQESQNMVEASMPKAVSP